MKRSYLLVAASAAILASSACNKESGSGSSTAPSTETVNVARPASGDWSESVIATPQGGYLMGDPNAKVKLVEIGALTCSHCREFDETGAAPLIEKYVKTGQVSWEFRPYLLSGLDVPANLIVGCNGPQGFFPLMRAIYKDQPTWLAKIQAAPAAQLQQIQTLPPLQQFSELAKLTDLQRWAAMRGVPQAKSDQCLKDQRRVDQLVQQTSDVVSQYPNFKGTPAFILNGEMLDIGGTWPLLEPEIKKALQ